VAALSGIAHQRQPKMAKISAAAAAWRRGGKASAKYRVMEGLSSPSFYNYQRRRKRGSWPETAEMKRSVAAEESEISASNRRRRSVSAWLSKLAS